MLLTPEDHRRVSDAVAAAERGTDGEIVAVVTRCSDAYHDVALHWAILAMLLVPATLAVLPQSAFDWITGLFLGWNAVLGRPQLMLLVLVALAAIFLLTRLVMAYGPLRMALTPGSTKTRRVHRRAVQLFRSTAEKKTRGCTGVLLYLSLDEHRAEIVADEAIHRQVEPEVWGEAMATLIDEVKAGRPGEGMAAAVAQIGDVLARILPRQASNPNELPDRVIEL